MKKLLLGLVLVLLTVSGCATQEKETHKVFNWGVYIDDTVISD